MMGLAHNRPTALRGPARAGAVRVYAPDEQRVPLVFASPHSGRAYEDAFLTESLAPLSVLRRSEDAYVDALFADVPRCGAPLVCATFPRVFVDPNRSPTDFDPNMFWDTPSSLKGPASARAAAGLGVVPRLAANGRALYTGRIGFAEAQRRLDTCYTPYHRRLAAEIAQTRERFGEAIVIDCHSMPAASARGADIVLGDRYGASCSRAMTARAEAHFRALGFAVVRNRPYAGGYTTEHYGHPETGVQALQIEINRGLYLNEAQVTPSAGLPALRRALGEWVSRIVAELSHKPMAAE